ncbi:glycoside hydrolase family 5 protein [Bipolaris zeicola 26-R-13]|uniref:glucan endo-1,6-beta-glucosidase n=1 Tax=Cochliobolus carbonum (strain 26-R-13) TaxID=930089 RepID=W6XR99_COCC2|nr:glycoside hydrolase family 5 protein [Bipolaris zeicola 26-R-13]EUC29967.1 glycoside hydrolase family 5 protein [Bipolaris zeicola 26-R-13]
MVRGSSLLTALLAASAHAWMPEHRELGAFNRTSNYLSKRAQSLPNWKVRGVNLGGWLLSEPWMMNDEWKTMGCGNTCSEFDCVSALGQSKADTAFNDHYARWITPSMIQDMYNAGLNTIRIPIGYWSLRSIVDSSEKFPKMDLQYLDAIVEKAANLGMFVVMDLHGAPGAQKTLDAFTGQCLPVSNLPGFFTQYNYDRATKWLDWMTRRIHTKPAYKSSIGIIGVVNEPQTSRDQGGMPKQEVDTLTQVYYPQALKAVRAAEQALNIPETERLHVQFMDTLWGAGNPKSHLPANATRIVYDDHNYIGGAVIAKNPDAKQADYMYYTCFEDDRLSDGDTPKMVQEWSLTVKNEYSAEFDWKLAQNEAFYKQWFVAQQRLYERTNGWIFWSWRTQLNDPRWDYSYLVWKKWVPTTAAGLDASAKQDVCAEYFGNEGMIAKTKRMTLRKGRSTIPL